jgi:AsmA-like C-terminal region
MTVATEKAVQAPKAKRIRWLIPVVAVVLVLLCVGGVILALHWPFSSQNVVQSVQEDWPGKIGVQRFHRTYFPHPGCVLEGVTLTRGSATSGPPLVAVQKVTIEANYHDLLLRPGYVSAILLEGLKISVPIEQADDHASAGSQQASSFEKSSKSSSPSIRLGQVFTKDAVLEIATKSDGPLKFEIHELTLKSITHDAPMSYDLAMRNPEPPGEIRARGKLGPWDSQHLDTIPLSGSYAFDKADLGVYGGIAGTLSAKGQFQGVLGKIETQGTTEIPDFEVTRSHHPVALKTKFTATVDGTGGDIILRSVDGSFLHTAVHVDGNVTSKPGKPGKTTSLNATVQGGHIEDLLRLFNKDSKPPMEGLTNIRARATWPSSDQSFLKRLSLQGDFSIAQARWQNPERQANVNDLSKRASGNKKDANTPDVTADIKGSVALSQAIATLHDVSCNVPGAQATLNGTYNLENAKIDFRGELKTVAALSNETSGMKSVLLKPLDPLFKRKRAGAVVPVAMTGTYNDPHFGISLPGK